MGILNTQDLEYMGFQDRVSTIYNNLFLYLALSIDSRPLNLLSICHFISLIAFAAMGKNFLSQN